MAFEERLQAAAEATEAALDRFLPTEGAAPGSIAEAMRYAALGGGKRFRPFLVLESARLFAGPAEAALNVAAAFECVHCYSLVHDDLPAMDDDDMRRGRPTVHKAFDEATAILAGDALLTLAFEILGDAGTRADPQVRADLVLCLARASGAAGMVGGQALDLAAEKRALDEPEIVRLQAMKTGALIAASCEAGAIVAGASGDDRARLRRYGEIIGAAFQLADDLLDVAGDAAAVGKRTGKDAERGKATLVSIHGEDWARARLDELVQEASAVLDTFGVKASVLREAPRFVAERTS
ncbi:polyprenyl synthetase family protein [Amorphus orientalis]|uniref:Probable farnesyl diphosphate synthase n=1 Tax=Amorphus orientalis TaxID=649198 RepID=A0AAE3VN78_9HYPH|nr:farnesyl diphosphate synthase [Amorphus orientalis]MDQ0315152.1 farnesyl diphosphate synthase [Amorphus orientalis]